MVFIQIAILLLLLIIVGVVSNHLRQILLNNSAPFFASNKKIIEKVIKNIDTKPGIKIYELGCGKAKFLKKLRKKYPNQGLKLIGIENFAFPLTLLKIQNKIWKYDIEVRNEDIFQADISDADVIYCFLNVEAMKKLKHKLLFECKSGAKIISYQFSIPEVEPDEIIKHSPRNKIFIYQV